MVKGAKTHTEAIKKSAGTSKEIYAKEVTNVCTITEFMMTYANIKVNKEDAKISTVNTPMKQM